MIRRFLVLVAIISLVIGLAMPKEQFILVGDVGYIVTVGFVSTVIAIFSLVMILFISIGFNRCA